MNNLQHKVIWLIGASSGIGQALAEELLKFETKLIISARRKDKLAEIASKSKNFFPLTFDISEQTARQHAVTDALSIFGHIDIVIFNAGLSQRTLTEETPLANTRQIMETNFFGTIDITGKLLTHMKNNNGGRFVVISSLMGKFGAQKRCAYAASKHALHGYFDSLRAEEYQNNIHVNIAVPGYIKTEFSVNALTSDGSKYGKIDRGQINGMNANKCAKIIIKNILKEKEEFLVGGKETFAALLKRYFPQLLSRILKNKNIS